MRAQKLSCRISLVAAAMLTALAGCAIDEISSQTQQAGSAVSLMTNKSAYGQGEDVIVNFSNTSGASTDWISIARTTDQDNVYAYWQYTNGGTSGVVTFTAPDLPPGTYEARMYYDWAGTSSFTVQLRSAPFTVGSGISTTSLAYTQGAPVVVNYAGLPGNQLDWIGIALPNSPYTSFLRYEYTNGNMSGQVTFNGISNGTYVARSFLDDGYTLGAESTPFTVGGGSSVVVTTDNPTYQTTDSITVSWQNLSNHPTNWVTLAPAGSQPTTYGQWFYTGGATSGSQQFSPIGAGSWEARVFLDDGFTEAGHASFTVGSGGSASVMTTQASYTSSETVTVNWGGLPGNQLDWVAVSPDPSSDSTYLRWTYVNGMTSGSQAFGTFAPGAYEARAYSNDSFNVLARYSFTVTSGGPSTTIMTDSQSYTSGATVNVNWTGLAGTPQDWIGISIAGSLDTQYVAYVYTGGGVNGNTSFANLPDGSYEARAYPNDSFNVAARYSFSIGP